jgi:hypothetical protein
MSKREVAVAWLVVLTFVAALVTLAIAEETWGPTIWGDIAPGWPGGGYAFTGSVGAAVPLALAALIAPLTRMNWKKSKARSLTWAAASLPGLAACTLFLFVILATWRPKRRRDWDYECYSKGGSCWVHAQYPYVWAVGLAATLFLAAALIFVLVRRADACEGATANAAEPSAT